jgi:THO complex subunit 1 transcription elongation factor
LPFFQFATSVEHLLKREEQWNKWKNDGCPPLVAQTAATVKNGDQKSLSLTGTPTFVLHSFGNSSPLLVLE